MKRMFAALFAVLFLSSALSVRARAAAPTLSAASAILVDGGSGRVLFSQNADEERAIASITKLMTALVAVESTADLSQEVTVKREYTLTEGSSMYLKVGEKLTLEDLLYGLLLVSGNDAALAVAGFCAGDVETFVEWMNRKAEELGMEHSHFSNPNGLSSDDHYSTAADMAKLARVVMDNEILAKIVSTKSITIGARSLTNHNKLLWQYEGCVGMKTGYTDKAGRTLVSSAERDGQRLIAVTLCDPNDWRDHAALFDYGFEEWPGAVLATAGKDVRSLPVTGSLVRFVPVRTESGVSYPLGAGERVTARVDLPETVKAPVEEGAIAGSLTFYMDGEPIGSTYLVYSRSVKSDALEEQSLVERILSLFRGDKTANVMAAFYPRTLQN